LIEVAKAVIPKDNFNKAIGKIQKVLIDDVSLFKEIKAEKVPTAKETKAINELQIKVVDAFVDAITPYTGENGDLVNMVVVTDPKGMFLDLQEKGFITKAEGGREITC
jgi:hypothetical protein